MTKEITTRTEARLREKSAEQEKKLDRPSASSPSVPLFFNPFLNRGFFSFRYSYQEMSSVKGQTHVFSREYRYENGKLSSEEFEGTTDGIVHEKAVQNMQSLVANSMDFFVKSFFSMLPSVPGKKDRD